MSPLLSPYYFLRCPFVLPHKYAESRQRPLASTPNGAMLSFRCLPVSARACPRSTVRNIHDRLSFDRFHSIAGHYPSLTVKAIIISFSLIAGVLHRLVLYKSVLEHGPSIYSVVIVSILRMPPCIDTYCYTATVFIIYSCVNPCPFSVNR